MRYVRITLEDSLFIGEASTEWSEPQLFAIASIKADQKGEDWEKAEYIVDDKVVAISKNPKFKR